MTEILKNDVLRYMNLPEDEVKWAQEALEEHMRKDTNFNHAKCRRYMGLMKQLLKAKVITDLGSVSPDQVVKRGPMEMEVNRRVDLPPGADGRLMGPFSQLMKAARYLSGCLAKSWEKAGSNPPAVVRGLSAEAGALREPAHQSPLRTDSINSPHRSDGSRCGGSLGCDGDRCHVGAEHVAAERASGRIAGGGGGRRHERRRRLGDGRTCVEKRSDMISKLL